MNTTKYIEHGYKYRSHLRRRRRHNNNNNDSY
ncbi:MAG: hypothetical protein ACI8RD_011483, partial [Bacillariaceae sp.]